MSRGRWSPWTRRRARRVRSSTAGDFADLDARSLGAYLVRMRSQHREMLLCWDAPLTGPREPDDAGGRGDFTQRPIESFFRDGKRGCKAPPGVSVLGYGQCPHWTITRSLIGLPRLGPYDASYEDLPFDLLSGGRLSGHRRHVVAEIHPGVAAWLWCREQRCGNVSWAYKSDAAVLAEMWEIIRSETACIWGDGPTPTNDDQFDAAVGYILGRALVGGEDCGVRVAMLGDRRTGSFLLPDSPRLRGKWEYWLSRGPVTGGRKWSTWRDGGADGASAR